MCFDMVEKVWIMKLKEQKRKRNMHIAEVNAYQAQQIHMSHIWIYNLEFKPITLKMQITSAVLLTQYEIVRIPTKYSLALWNYIAIDWKKKKTLISLKHCKEIKK